MVEIAISLAIIGFALVAIIGVLPTGLDVQKENRQATIIDHDANYMLDAIRNGARGVDDLTNYVFAITNYWTVYDVDMKVVDGPDYDGYTNNNSRVTSVQPPPFLPLTNGYRIIGLLGRPKYEPVSGDFRSNYVVAYCRALSGSASEKVPQRDPAVQDLAFSYRFTSEIVPVATPLTNTAYGANLQTNLHDLRLLFRWPLLPGGKTGNGREVYRAQVGGRLWPTSDAGHPLFFFEPAIFTNAHAP